MKIFTPHFTLGLVAAAVVTLTACGGGGGGSTSPSAPVGTTPVTPTVLDGLIQNALVCVDSNNDGVCQATEIQGRTDVNGKVTLNIPTADLASAKLVAMIGTDATDADTGPVKTAYTLRTSAGKHSVISPLTNALQTKLDLDKTKTFEVAEAEVRTELGLNTAISVTDNFIEKRDHGTEAERAVYKTVSDKAREQVLKLQKTSDDLRKLNCRTSSEEHGGDSEDDYIRKILVSSETKVKSILDTDDSVKAACRATTFSKTCDDAIKAKVEALTPAILNCAPSANTPVTPTPTPTSTPTPTPVVSAVNGKALYSANTCFACHGTPPSSQKVLNGANNPDRILSAINSNTGGMGMYSGKLNPQQLTDMAAYLATPGI